VGTGVWPSPTDLLGVGTYLKYTEHIGVFVSAKSLRGHRLCLIKSERRRTRGWKMLRRRMAAILGGRNRKRLIRTLGHARIDPGSLGEVFLAETLFYEYRGPFFVPARLHGYRGRVGNLDVIELRSRSKFVPYTIRMECRVTTKEQARQYDAEARQLASDLNIVWPYVALVPLFPKRFMIRLSGSPDGWRTNFKKLKSTHPIKPRQGYSPGPPLGFSVSLKINKGQYKVTSNSLLLQRAIDAVRAFRTASPEARFLMQIHFAAIDQLGVASQHILYAKAFDLARDLLPGYGNSKKEAALPVHARSALRQSLSWLGEMSNRRLETRHVASGGKLLPRMSAAENADFGHDADLVIRAVVEKELGIAAIVKP
jgi:hypothetical protein